MRNTVSIPVGFVALLLVFTAAIDVAAVLEVRKASRVVAAAALVCGDSFGPLVRFR